MHPRILVLDDHALLADAVAAAFRARGFGDVGTLSTDVDDETLLEQFRASGADLVLLDIHLGGDRVAVPLVAPMVAAGATVVVVTASRDPLLLGACIEAGAAGLLDKSQPFGELVRMVSAAADGAPVLSPSAREVLLADLNARRRNLRGRLAPFQTLTPKESEVFLGLLEGHVAETIAGDLGMALPTVRTHIRAILTKLHVKTQLGAVAAARRAGWPAD